MYIYIYIYVFIYICTYTYIYRCVISTSLQCTTANDDTNDDSDYRADFWAILLGSVARKAGGRTSVVGGVASGVGSIGHCG